MASKKAGKMKQAELLPLKVNYFILTDINSFTPKSFKLTFPSSLNLDEFTISNRGSDKQINNNNNCLHACQCLAHHIKNLNAETLRETWMHKQ